MDRLEQLREELREQLRGLEARHIAEEELAADRMLSVLICEEQAEYFMAHGGAMTA